MPTLVVQQGHCYRTAGATGTEGEQSYATQVANAIYNTIHGREGWSVNRTLADENDYAGSAFAAIHCDGSTNTSARGSSVGYKTPEGQAFGQNWKTAYYLRGWSGGFRPDNYTVSLSGYYGVGNAVAAGNRSAIIIECGFLTNPEDRAILTAPDGPTRVALSVADALGIEVDEMSVENIERMMWKGGAVAGSIAAGTLIDDLHKTMDMLWKGGPVAGTTAPGTIADDLNVMRPKVEQLISEVAGIKGAQETLMSKLDQIINILNSTP